LDPGCVKTHTSSRCRKCNSQVSHRVASAQHDLALITRNHFEIFYASGERSRFHTAKTRSGPRSANLARCTTRFPGIEVERRDADCSDAPCVATELIQR